jgi:hypothetical protein
MQISFDRNLLFKALGCVHNNPQPDKTLDLRVLLQDFINSIAFRLRQFFVIFSTIKREYLICLYFLNLN